MDKVQRSIRLSMIYIVKLLKLIRYVSLILFWISEYAWKLSTRYNTVHIKKKIKKAEIYSLNL
jgi:hypothetical protein